MMRTLSESETHFVGAASGNPCSAGAFGSAIAGGMASGMAEGFIEGSEVAPEAFPESAFAGAAAGGLKGVVEDGAFQGAQCAVYKAKNSKPSPSTGFPSPVSGPLSRSIGQIFGPPSFSFGGM